MKIFLFLLLSLGLYAEENKELERLMKGNQRYIEDKLEYPDHSADRRKALVASQEPFAVILSCSDSRVPPEIIFDQNVGDLFVVRLAGNVAGKLATESIGYATNQLHSSLIFVMGHQNCGAVSAVLSHQTEGISGIASLIEPAVKSLKEDDLEKAIKANVRAVVKTLKNSPDLGKNIAIFGGYYHLKSGQVELLEDES
ncbi:MAG: Carbonic anhydrase 2 [Chlamydiae bacterium]|nr:Carbonic anhydrase 2 [Chlamydiota bacterium]